MKCRPPRNRDPEPLEVEACSHFLDEQIELLQPDVILLLGRHALTRLLPDAGGISRLHGERAASQRPRLRSRCITPLRRSTTAALKETLEADMRRVRGYLADAEAARARRAGGASASELRKVAAAAGGDQMDLF